MQSKLITEVIVAGDVIHTQTDAVMVDENGDISRDKTIGGEQDKGYFHVRLYPDEGLLVSQRIEYGVAVKEERFVLNPDGSMGEAIDS